MGANRRTGAARYALAMIAGALGVAVASPVLAACVPGSSIDVTGTTVAGTPSRDRPINADTDMTITGVVQGDGLHFDLGALTDFDLTNEATVGDGMPNAGIVWIEGDGGDVCYDGLAAAGLANADLGGIGLEITNTGTGAVTVFSAHDIDADVGIVVDTVSGVNTISVTGGAITAIDGPGIAATSLGGAIEINVAAGATIDAFDEAIYALGDGGISITSAGTLISTWDAISADALDSDISIMSMGTIETTGPNGIMADVTGSGDIDIGSITQRTGSIKAAISGIQAGSLFGGIVNDITIYTGGKVTAAIGITALQSGSGDILIDTAGDFDVVGAGILVFHGGDSGDVTIRTASGSTISVSDPFGLGVGVQRQGVSGSTGTVTIDNRADIVMDNGLLGLGDDVGITANLCDCVNGGLTVTNRGDITASMGIDAVSSTSLSVNHLDGRITSSVVGIVAEAWDTGGLPTPLINITVGADAKIVADTGISVGLPGAGVENPTNIVIAGSVNGTGGTALELSLGPDVLTLQPGYELIGEVAGQDDDDTLVLGGDSGSGTFDLDAFGTQFTSFQDFRKRGTSTWTVVGSGTFADTISVEAGRLNVSGVAAQLADFVVSPGAVLGGNGNLDGAVLAGTLAPGNSIGTINANTFTFGAGSSFEVEINSAGAADRLNVANGVNIDPTASVLVVPEAGTYVIPRTYRIIGATTVVGAFDPNLTTPPLLTATLAYDPLGVLLTVVRNSTTVSSLGLTPNQRATGAALDAMLFNAPYLAEIIGTPAADVPALLDALSGDGYASIKGAMLEDSRFLREAILQRLQAAREALPAVTASGYAGAPLISDAFKDKGAWLRAYGGSGTVDTDGNAATIDRNEGGLIAGLDGAVADFRLGGILSYGQSGLAIPARRMSGSSQKFSVGAYGGYEHEALSLSAGGTYSYNAVSTTRVASFAGVNDTFTAQYGAAATQAFAEAGCGLKLGMLEATPFAGLAYTSVGNSAFTEAGTGAAGALSVAATASDALFTTLGVKVAHDFAVGDGVLVTAKASVAWRHAIAALVSSSNAFAGGPQFVVVAAPIGADALSLTAGLGVDLNPTAALSLDYSGEVSANARSHALTGTFTASF